MPATLTSGLTPADAASCLPRKEVEGEFDSVADDGTFAMYALVFGNVDRQGDRIKQGAVTNTDELITDGWIALNHVQTDLPVATISTAIQDSHGLKLTGAFHSTPEAQKVRTVVKERLERGKKVKTSIGYLVPPEGEQYVKEDGRTIRDISKLSVYEASFVNLPANNRAEVVSAKSLGGQSTAESEDEMSAAAVLKEVKRALGIQVKSSSYKIDGEEMEKMKAAHQKCMGAHKAMMGHCKALGDALKDYGEAHEDMTKCFKNFTSGQQQDKDPKNSGDEADKDDVEEGEQNNDEGTEDNDDEDTPTERRRPKKSVRSKVKEDEDDDDHEEKALDALRLKLRRDMLRQRAQSLSR